MGDDGDVKLFQAVGARSGHSDATNRMDIRRLALEELLLAGFGVGTTATLLPRGQRIVACARGELPTPVED